MEWSEKAKEQVQRLDEVRRRNIEKIIDTNPNNLTKITKAVPVLQITGRRSFISVCSVPLLYGNHDTVIQ